MPPLRLYIETSVWSHYFADDAPEWREQTRLFVSACLESANRLEMHVSRYVVDELLRSPIEKARDFIALLDRMRPVVLPSSTGAEELARAYARHSAIPPSREADAMHVAIATIHEMDAVVSWNYRHLVSYARRQKINAVNQAMGYNKRIEIVTPPEINPDAG